MTTDSTDIRKALTDYMNRLDTDAPAKNEGQSQAYEAFKELVPIIAKSDIHFLAFLQCVKLVAGMEMMAIIGALGAIEIVKDEEIPADIANALTNRSMKES